MKLLLSTQNQGKLHEMKTLLSNLDIEVVLPESDFDVEETGKTFEENAKLKAKEYSKKYGGVLTLADDSGLVVDALDGRPGVYSKRYGIDDQDRNSKLLNELKDASNRKAHFICVMCLYGEGFDQCVEGKVSGRIGYEAKGKEGFGYDPVFIPDGYDDTFAELGVEVKNTLSHRARALEQIRNILQKII